MHLLVGLSKKERRQVSLVRVVTAEEAVVVDVKPEVATELVAAARSKNGSHFGSVIFGNRDFVVDESSVDLELIAMCLSVCLLENFSDNLVALASGILEDVSNGDCGTHIVGRVFLLVLVLLQGNFGPARRLGLSAVTVTAVKKAVMMNAEIFMVRMVRGTCESGFGSPLFEIVSTKSGLM